MEAEINDENLMRLLNDIFELYGYDFTGYSKESMRRRMERLFVKDNFVSFAEFRYRIRNNSEYFRRLLQEITVNVTEMLRDPLFYKMIRKKILPVLATYPFIRIWIAGCSTGEEAYSMAILLKEADILKKSLLYATDINPLVVEKARKGIFPVNQVKQYSENYIRSGGESDFSAYYTSHYQLAKFDEELSEKMVFSTHNLVSDFSFNEFQLILCRNVMIYFDKQLQAKVLNLFDRSLVRFGYLGLGAKESLRFSPIASRYKQLELKEKLWQKIDDATD